MKELILISIVLISIFSSIYGLRQRRKCPFHYPYFEHEFDVSGKRAPIMEDYIDMFLIKNGFQKIKEHNKIVSAWKKWSRHLIRKSIFKKHRQKQYNRVMDDANAYRFSFVRRQTRYRQKNYVKTSYTVWIKQEILDCDYEYLKKRYEALETIGFECTLSQYHSKKQRALCTRELRERVMKRDNYTCRLCGKYMPDEVGLQVDHILPISKGGKTVMSNLQVLCSKCNGSKYNKT